MIRAIRAFADDIRIFHSIFALPFVGVAICLTPNLDLNTLRIVKIILCMFFARSFAMGINRIADAKIDAKNARTSLRAIPAGLLSLTAAWQLTLVNAILFVLVSFTFSVKIGVLSALLLVVLAGYSFMKRISFLTHWYLGICLGLAPLAAQLALADKMTIGVAAIGLSVTFWTAGFDILYSLQDKDFDREMNLNSAPAKLGHVKSLILSVCSFLAMIVALVIAGLTSSSGFFYFLGVGVIFLILVYEQWIVRDAWRLGTSKNIDKAFFSYNAFVSVAFFLFVVVDRINLRNV